MSADNPNADQQVYWNEGAGPTWAEQQALLDWQLAPLGAAAIAALRPAPDERILDTGCGTGATSVELAAAVGEAGAVLGADLSAPMLEVARGRTVGRKDLRLEFIQADAQTHAFAPAAFDAVFSRFGVMFFADPVAAFANLLAALKPGGRIAFVCWRSVAENAMFTLPMTAALAHLDAPQPASDPHAPGPFAFAEEARLRSILESAGFEAVQIRPHDEPIGARNLDDALTLALRIGPLGSLLRAAPEKRGPVTDAVRVALEPYVTDRGCLVPSATWIVTGRRPG